MVRARDCASGFLGSTTSANPNSCCDFGPRPAFSRVGTNSGLLSYTSPQLLAPDTRRSRKVLGRSEAGPSFRDLVKFPEILLAALWNEHHLQAQPPGPAGTRVAAWEGKAGELGRGHGRSQCGKGRMRTTAPELCPVLWGAPKISNPNSAALQPPRKAARPLTQIAPCWATVCVRRFR